MWAEGEAPAGGLAGATGVLGAFGELGAGCDGGGIGPGSGEGCWARSDGAISRIRPSAPCPMDSLVIDFLRTAFAQAFPAMIGSPDFLLTDYEIGSIHVTARSAAVPENPIGHRGSSRHATS